MSRQFSQSDKSSESGELSEFGAQCVWYVQGFVKVELISRCGGSWNQCYRGSGVPSSAVSGPGDTTAQGPWVSKSLSFLGLGI